MSVLFFLHATPTPEIYTLSLHDALPICDGVIVVSQDGGEWGWVFWPQRGEYANTTRFLTDEDAVARLEVEPFARPRSEEHTSELQSHSDLVCRLLLEKKKKMSKRERTDK